jgi:hypothetical protein
MGKLPNWMKVEEFKRGQKVNQAVIVITIRRWHPGWWWFYWSHAVQSARECHAPFYIWFPASLYRFLFVGREYVGNGVEIDHE